MKFDTAFFTGTKGIFVFLTLLAIVAAVWLGIDIKNRLDESENVISVSATSEVYAQPDLALTSFSVLTEAKTVGEAMEENTTRMNDVIAFVKSEGVEDKDLKTTNFSISPRYEWYEAGACSTYYCPSGQRVLVGYEVSQSLQVKMRDLAKIGDIIQGATESGANDVGSLSFTIDNEDSLKEEARTKAIAEAKAKAEALADQLGIRLVRITSFSETGDMPVYYPSTMKSSEALGMGGGATPDIQTGENKISVTVYLTYQIR